MTPQQIKDKYCIAYGECLLRNHQCIKGIEGGVRYCLQCKRIKLKQGKLVAL